MGVHLPGQFPRQCGPPPAAPPPLEPGPARPQGEGCPHHPQRDREGRRFPSVGTYARLREALALEAAPTSLIPRRAPTPHTDTLLRRLCATLIAARRLPLADLAAALEIAIPACRELLLAALPG